MIHQYRFDDLNIVLDINSGSVHLVDDLSYRIIEAYEQKQDREAIIDALSEDYDRATVEEGLEEVACLVEQGQLFAEDEYEETLNDFVGRRTVVKAMCLHIAHDCNLACAYCFAGEGEYHGPRGMMSIEVGKKAVDYLIAQSGNRKNLEIDFFGGEPLMNFDTVKAVVAYARSREEASGKKFRFTITTNGVLLDEDNMAFINENMYNVVLSVDGRKEVHDRMRPTPNGKGSYDIIMPKFKAMAEARGYKDYYVRGTFTGFNKDFASDVMHLADEGFNLISVEPVVTQEDVAYALTDNDLETLKMEYHTLARQMESYRQAGKGFKFFHFMIDLGQGPCVAKRLSGCGAGLEYLAVTPDGDLYPCHQFVGIDDYLLGNLEEGIHHPEKQDGFRSCHVYAKETCKTCWAKFYCGGGCAANSYHFHKNLNKVYEIGCELEKKRVECAIYTKAKELTEGEED